MAPKKLSDVPYSCIHGLSRILDTCPNPDQNWRALAERLELYSTVDIACFERESLQLHGSPCRSLLTDWAMTGRNIDELYTIIYKMRNVEAFLFLKESGHISKNLMNSLHLERKAASHQNSPHHNTNPSVSHPDSRSIMRNIYNDANDSASSSLKGDSNDLSLSIVAQRKDSITDDILPALRNKGLIEFSFEEVSSATNNFDDSSLTGGCKLGMGSFGTVFKGELKNTTFAIKKLNLQDNMQARSIGLSQFAVEVLALSKYRHPHLLELVGYSLNPKAPCLIYYFMEKGSLANVLASPESTDIQWEKRLQISGDILKGLVYLHTASEKPLIHRDLKSANVLLTNDFKAKIGDFGLARLGSDQENSIIVTNRLQGTRGYISPEAARGNISTKTDTYSYGVLMLELLTNLCAFDPNRGYLNQSLVGLVENKLSIEGDIVNLVSPMGVRWPYNIAKKFVELSQVCFEEHNLRPNADIVLQTMTNLIQESSSISRHDKWVEPGNIVLSEPKPVCENRRTILVLTKNRHQSSLIQAEIGKFLEGESQTSTLRTLKEMEFHFMTLYDAIIIVCNPVSEFSKCLLDSINRFNPHLVILTGLVPGVRPKVSLGDLIFCTEIPAGNVIYSVSEKIQNLIQKVQKSENCGDALWKLPGLLPRPPSHTASQVLLWISKLIVEVNSENPVESEWLNEVEYDHSLGYESVGFLNNMKAYHAKYPCLHSANMTLLYDRTTNAIDPDVNLKAGLEIAPGKIDLKRRKFSPKLHVGLMSPLDIPYQHGLAFNRTKLCPPNMLGSDLETLELYSLCNKSQTPCISIKSVYSFSDPYEDARYDDVAIHMSALGVVQFIGAFLSS